MFRNETAIATARHGGAARVDWVDIAKAISIVLVVMMHSTLGVEKAVGAEGFMHHAVAFAQPIRMPAFFLICGLFLSNAIDRPWRAYLDVKVVHFAYFYLLWLAIQGAVRWPGIAMAEGPGAVVQLALLSLVEPLGTLWFIHLLPILFLAARALRGAPPLLVLASAAALQLAGIHTGWTAIDEFAARAVYFCAGWYFAPHVFAFAGTVAARPGRALLALGAWAGFNAACVAAQMEAMPGMSLFLGTTGAAAVVAASVLIARLPGAAALRHIGANSIVVYLAFTIPMAASRVVLLKLAPGVDIGVVSIVVTAAAVLAPLVLHLMVRGTRLGFLFERPARFRLRTASPPRGLAKPAAQPAA